MDDRSREDDADERRAATDGGSSEPIGRTEWTFPGGHVPVESTGSEPEMVSHEKLCVLNAGGKMARLEITLHYADGREAGPYLLAVAPERVRHVRINDLIDPYAPPLGREYGFALESNVPVVVQATRQDTRRAENATLSTIAYGDDGR
ncbi:sensory rhodopsin transducer [Natrarchaeobius sp. A-rgal3]|uniref:sensory rhodopsin transducer n=1 Tax=Natrarchaeobius versutus TaxID=1679078 RepID=UPI003510BFCB